MINKLREFRSIIKSINEHPLAGRHKLKSYFRLFRWQLGCLVSPIEKKVAFTDRTFLIAKKGMAGATGNIYMGLHEFPDMGFLLHFLRRDDLFFDIGSNIGSYTVLASGHAGAKTFAFEPVPSTFSALQKNIRINKLEPLVRAFNVGVGSQKGLLTFTSGNDTVNHVIQGDQLELLSGLIEVPVISIDEIVHENSAPVMIKMDVEGFETEVLNGMKLTLQNENLKAIIIELNGSGGRYGYDERDIHSLLLSTGFQAYTYDPFLRKLQNLETYGFFNTIYLRDLNFITGRILSADKLSLFSENF